MCVSERGKEGECVCACKKVRVGERSRVRSAYSVPEASLERGIKYLQLGNWGGIMLDTLTMNSFSSAVILV